MVSQVMMGEPEGKEDVVEIDASGINPDEFFAKKAFRIIYQTNNFFLPQVRDLIEKGEVLNVQPEYQRRLRWSSAQKSKLIESLLLNIPIPPIFLYESEAARYEVMDGQQRLNAVREFLGGDFGLTSLSVLKPLNGLKYEKCPPRIKRALDRSSLSAIVLLLESEVEASPKLTMSEIRRFIFDRLNTGGTKLNPQEIRNAINPGPLNKVIVDLTRHSLFTTVFEIPAYSDSDESNCYGNVDRQKNNLYATMGDCQLVLRYFALRDEDNIRGSMRSMLDRAMEKKRTFEEALQLKDEYILRLEFLNILFRDNPFRLPPDEKGRERISAAMYDASMVAINQLWDIRSTILADAEGVLQRMNKATREAKTLEVLTGQGNTAISVKDRISLMRRIFQPEPV